MDKEIRINKGTGKEIGKNEKVIEMDDLSKAIEFNPNEIKGFINLSINQYVQDWVSLEIQHRNLSYLMEMLRGKEKLDEANAKLNEVSQRQKNILEQIRFHRQVRDEIGDGRLKI